MEAWITWPLEIPLDSSLLDGYYVVERLLEKEPVTKLEDGAAGDYRAEDRHIVGK